MTFTLFYTRCVIISTIMLVGCAAWDVRHPDSVSKPLTLQNVMVGICMVVIPIINFFVIAFFVFYFYTEIAPQIVLFGKRNG